MTSPSRSQLALFCLAASAALALAGCAAGPLGTLASVALSLALGLGLSACYSHADQSPSGLRREVDGGLELVPGDGGSQVDRDGDGYTADEDCDDGNPNANPGAFDPDPCDGVRLDCVWVSCNPFVEPEVDNDGDGYAASQDCDDGNPAVHPGAYEDPCGNTDSNCDGRVQIVACNPIAETDADGDGYGPSVDCNDANPAVHPGAYDPDPCDGVDEDCDITEWACNPFVVEEDAGTDDPEL